MDPINPTGEFRPEERDGYKTLTVDRLRGIRKYLKEDEKGNVTVHTQQLMDPALSENEQMRNSANSGWKGNRHLVASIPIAVWNSLPEEIQQDHKALLRWLDKSENKVFRTKEGTLA